MGFDLKRVNPAGAGKTIGKTIPGLSDAIGDTPLGEYLGISTKDVWRLKMSDKIGGDEGPEFRGQFTATNLTENVGQRITSTNALNQEDADRKYLGGSGDTITFNARIWATSSLKNVAINIHKLKSFCRRDDELKRSPIFTFTAGTEFECTCFVKSIGNIIYDPLRSDGSIRGATFQITLVKLVEVPPDKQGVGIASLVKTGLGIVSSVSGLSSTLGKIYVPGGSLHTKGKEIITVQGQTFEHLAQKHYNNALFGDVLRRAYYHNPQNTIKTSLECGDVVDIVDPDEIQEIDITPQSISLKDNIECNENIVDHFSLRSDPKRVYL